jgi:hypothetical protein
VRRVIKIPRVISTMPNDLEKYCSRASIISESLRKIQGAN